MPKISTFNIRSTQGTIDQRVQTGQIDKSGAGAVARAVGNIGAQGANLANQYLLEAKREEASDFSKNNTTNKELARNEYMNKTRGTVDAFTGKLPDGTEWEDDIVRWEDDYDKNVVEDAPTDLARRSYKVADAGSRRKNLVQEQKWQFTQQQVHREDNLDNNAQTRSKILQAQNSQILKDSGSSLTRETEESILDTVEDVTSFNSGQFSRGPVEADRLLKKHGNGVAVAGVKSMIRNEEYGETLDVMGVGQVINNNKEFKAQMEQFLTKELGRKVNIIKAMNDRVLKLAPTVGSKDGEVFFDVSKGVSVQMPMIGITGLTGAPTDGPERKEFQPGLILNNVTPQQQHAFINQAVAGAFKKSKKSSREVLNRGENLIAAMKAPMGEDGRETYDSTPGHAFSDKVRQFIAQVNVLPDNVMDPTSKLNAISRMASTAMASRNTDEASKWSTLDKDELNIEVVDEQIEGMLKDSGVEYSSDDLRKVKLQTKRELRILAGNKANKIAKNPEQYILENDDGIKLDMVTAQEIENTNIEQRLAGGQPLGATRAKSMYSDIKKDMDSRYEDLGYGGDRKYFTDNQIKGDLLKIKGLEASGTGNREQLAVFLQESIDSKGDLAGPYFDQLVKEGLDPAYLLATKTAKDVTSVATLKEIADVVSDKDQIRGRFSELQQNELIKTTIPELSGLAQIELSPLTTHFSASGNFNDRRRELESYKDIIVTKAADLLNTGLETNSGEAIKSSYDLFLKDAYVEGFTKKGSMFVPGRKVKELGITNDHLDAVAETFSEPVNLPLDRIDFMGMVSVTEQNKIGAAIISSRPKGYVLKKDDVERQIQKNFVEEKYGDLTLQDNGDNFYMTVTPVTGVSNQAQVVKLKKEAGQKNSKELRVNYVEAIQDGRVLDKVKTKKEDEKTAVDNIIDFFGKVF